MHEPAAAFLVRIPEKPVECASCARAAGTGCQRPHETFAGAAPGTYSARLRLWETAGGETARDTARPCAHARSLRRSWARGLGLQPHGRHAAIASGERVQGALWDTQHTFCAT